jgi:hypothetical protein
LRSYKLVLLFSSALIVLAIVGFVNAKGSSRAKATRQSESCAGLAAAAREEFSLSREALRVSSEVSQLLGEVAVAAWTQDAHRLNVDSAAIATKQSRLRAISSREAALERRFDGSVPGCNPGIRTGR